MRQRLADEPKNQGDALPDSGASPSGPRLAWDLGSAYDLFISLYILHNPDDFGLRPSWAAGVRSRLTPSERKTLEKAQDVVQTPFTFIYNLPEPKDAVSALWALRQLPPEERLPALVFYDTMAEEVPQVLRSVMERGAWDDGDVDILRSGYRKEKHEAPRPKTISNILEAFSRPAEFGEAYLDALQAYHQAFFAEEEKQIIPLLQAGLEDAQELAERLPVPDLLEKLSQGVHFQELTNIRELVLAPSYWSSPFIFFGNLKQDQGIILFGARPADRSLVPGELVPDLLIRALKALADPTRLRILRYLAHEPLTPAELSRRLRLRPPTVTHHLRELRLAGLVHLTLVGSKKDDRSYTAREEALQTLFASLDDFLQSDLEKADEA